MIQVRNLCWRFADQPEPALHHIDLHIAPNEFVVLTGPSGCGKSLLALALGGYLFQQYDGQASGTVHVADVDIRQAPLYRSAELVGLVQQNPENQFCTLTVQDEVAFALENRRVPRQEIMPRIERALGAVDACHLLERKLDTLSGGEKQKVAIAAILAAQPQVLILDEPTSNLDPAATHGLFQAIAGLRRQAGLTTIVIEHKIGYLAPFATRLLRMERGAIIDDQPKIPPPSWPPPASKRPTPDPDAPELASLVNISHHYGTIEALVDVDLSVRAGQVVAVMGRNGSGKSTLLRAMLGLLQPHAGQVKMLDQEVSEVAVSTLAQKVGLAFQNPNHQLFGETVWEEALLGPRQYGLDREREAEALLAQYGLWRYRDRHPQKLSYGEKRRLNLVSLLTYGPRLYLLDEILIGQDSDNAQRLLDMVTTAARAVDGAVVMVTHDPWTAWQYANRVIYMERGRIALDAPTEEAFAQLAGLWRLPSRGNDAYGHPEHSKAGQKPTRDSNAAFYSPKLKQQDGLACRPEPAETLHPQIGQARLAYQPGSSWLHQLHPLVKLAWLIWLSVWLFWRPSVAMVLALGAACAIAWQPVRPAGRGIGRLKLMMATGVFLALLQVLFVDQGRILFHLWPFGTPRWPVTDVGLSRGVMVGGRFVEIVWLGFLYVRSTDPSALAYALMRAGLPYRYGFALITALRLMPVFESEGRTVYEAQLARGIAHDAHSPARILTLLRRLAFPLLVSALSKVDRLAISMEGRGFGQYRNRTYLRESHLDRLDMIALGVMLATIAITVRNAPA